MSPLFDKFISALSLAFNFSLAFSQKYYKVVMKLKTKFVILEKAKETRLKE